jgi:microcompartment protein CcmL/EutN
MTGDNASVEAAVNAGSDVAGEDGILVDRQVIPRPAKELFKEFV